MLFDNSHAFFFFKNQARISVRDTDSLKAKDVPSPQPVKPSKPHLWLSASIFKFLSELNKPVIKNSKVAEPVFSNSHKV
jgi:hypothetical protein